MKKVVANFRVNGRAYELLVAPNMTLSELLRNELDLTGTKTACGVGECASCTVLVDGRPTLSCSTLALAARDKDIRTIEGLAKGLEPAPLQKAFMEQGAIQCGYCTPGMIMTAEALLNENPHPTREEVKEGLAGNICRCTGYVKIVDAVMAASEMKSKGGN